MEYEVEGPRPRGRPKRTWREVVWEDCQARKMNREDAVDRCKWRKMIKDVRWSGWVWVGECFFWYRPTRVVPDKRPLNGCVCVCACVRACVRACVCVWARARACADFNLQSGRWRVHGCHGVISTFFPLYLHVFCAHCGLGRECEQVFPGERRSASHSLGPSRPDVEV